MKQIIIFITLTLISHHNCEAQFSVGLDLGYSFNHLSTDISNRKSTKNINEKGFSTGLVIDYHISNLFILQTGIDLIQKNYSLVRTGYYKGIYETFTNSYLQVPLSLKFRLLQISRFKILFSAGYYGAYWVFAKVDGRMPNVFNSFNEINSDGQIIQYFTITSFSEKYKFDKIKDKRFEYGLVFGIVLNYCLNDRYSILIKSNYYYSFTDQQKKYMILQNSKTNQTFCMSIGFLMCL